MHPSLEELLAVRDGEAPGPIVEHLRGCEECRTEVARLGQVRERLQALPDPEPPRDLWPGIREALAKERRHRRVVGVSWAAAVLVAAAVGAVLFMRPAPKAPAVGKPAQAQQQVAVLEPAPQPGPQAQIQTRPQAPSVSRTAPDTQLASLIKKSQTLEGVLRRVDRQPRVQDGWEAAAITELQDRVAFVDGRIAQVKGQDSSKELVGLWQQRVRLLNALVKVQVDPRGSAQI